MGELEIDTVARRKFGKSYVELDDSQADAVWNEIEENE